MLRTLIRRGTAGVVAVLVAAAMVLAAPASAGSPRAKAAGEELLTYLTKGKLKVGKRIAYRVVCSVDCQLTATSTLIVKGGQVGPVSSTASFPAGQVAEAYLKPNKPARNAIKDNIGAAKLRTSVTATSVATGEADTDKRTYKFKK